MCFMLTKTSLSQNIEKSVADAKSIVKQDPLIINGNISASTVFYQANGIAPRRDPFYWAINANVSFSLFNKISVPFTAVFTKQNQQYTNGLQRFSQPFNQFGLSPSYKSVTIHAGYRSVEFSEYSLSGALFLGGGIEIKPKKTLVSSTAIYGRFVNTIPGGGFEGSNDNNATYKRMGGGVKIKVGTDQNFGEIIVLKIKDDVNSIPIETAFIALPQENQIIAIGTKQKLNKLLSVGCDFSHSFFTKNLFEEETKLDRFSYVNQIYAPRPSSQFNKAIVATIDLSPTNYKIGFKFKHIDPDYKSLGSVFLINDIQEISFNAGTSFLKRKLNLTISSGIQQNNLDKIQTLTSRRVIGALNLSYSINQNMNLCANYSNFSSNTSPIKDVINDTIKLVQINQNGTLSFNYAFGHNYFKHNLTSAFSYMETIGNDKYSNTLINETISYFLAISEIATSINFSIIGNQSKNIAQSISESIGPSLGIIKGFYREKLKVILNLGFTNTYLDKLAINKNKIYTLNINYTIDKHQSVKLNYSFLRKEALIQNAQQFQEIRLGINYAYNFGLKTKVKAN